jgi:hypothetical protein
VDAPEKKAARKRPTTPGGTRELSAASAILPGAASFTGAALIALPAALASTLILIALIFTARCAVAVALRARTGLTTAGALIAPLAALVLILLIVLTCVSLFSHGVSFF